MCCTYFICWYRLDYVNGYLIWYTNDVDRVLVDSITGKIAVFQDIASLQGYAENIGLQVEEEESILHDLDIVQSWLANPISEKIDCNSFLSIWNLFTDVASSVNDSTFDHRCQETDKIYNKLFFGNNLPAITQEGEYYEPVWAVDEVKMLSGVLEYGLSMFRQATQPQPVR